VVNYNFNGETHRIDPLEKVEFKLNFAAKIVKIHSFVENDKASFMYENSTLQAKDLGIYTIFEIN
jgi:hypothetical protein